MTNFDFVTINFTEGMELNYLGARYVQGNHYIDVMEHYLTVGELTDPKPFADGFECSEEDARAWMRLQW